MNIKRIYLDRTDCSFCGNVVNIRGDTLHYLSRVLRMREGNVFSGFDGTGREYEIEIESCEKNLISGRIKKLAIITDMEVPFDVTVFQSIPKGNKMDFIIKEISQLGIKKIVPVISRRVAGPVNSGKIHAKIERWKKISAASSSVSGRALVLEVSDKILFLKEALAIQADTSILFWEEAAQSLREITEKISVKKGMSVNIFVGPEGGFEHEEVKLARSCKVSIASLGKRILKVETASIIAAALTLYELENR